jgi:hypothetical protein
MYKLPDLSLVCQALKIVYENLGFKEKDQEIKLLKDEIKILKKDNLKLNIKNKKNNNFSKDDYICHVCEEWMHADGNITIYWCKHCGDSFCKNCGIMCEYSYSCYTEYCNNCLDDDIMINDVFSKIDDCWTCKECKEYSLKADY